ncbi:MAG: hypothetical protein DRJ05_10990 [Bacteroidetes bacterium]|nr:MAG: hypothetical protein DRJ05_10990 [Bacteroidota bacterium]
MKIPFVFNFNAFLDLQSRTCYPWIPVMSEDRCNPNYVFKSGLYLPESNVQVGIHKLFLSDCKCKSESAVS